MGALEASAQDHKLCQFCRNVYSAIKSLSQRYYACSDYRIYCCWFGNILNQYSIVFYYFLIVVNVTITCMSKFTMRKGCVKALESETAADALLTVEHKVRVVYHLDAEETIVITVPKRLSPHTRLQIVARHAEIPRRFRIEFVH